MMIMWVNEEGQRYVTCGANRSIKQELGERDFKDKIYIISQLAGMEPFSTRCSSDGVIIYQFICT